MMVLEFILKCGASEAEIILKADQGPAIEGHGQFSVPCVCNATSCVASAVVFDVIVTGT